MKKIELTRGVFTLVDDEDYLEFSKYSWHCTEHGYASRKDSNSKSHYLHRDIMQPEEGLCVDHINGDKLDNRRKNLRVVTQQQNTWNRKNSFGKLKCLGVYKPKTKWVLKKPYASRIHVNGKAIWLGRHATIEEASAAYQTAKKTYHLL